MAARSKAMNQAIEELRQKLREGRPVRVINGRVYAEGETPSKGKAPVNGGTAEPQGVQVKAHEWG